ncbi:MAG: alpha/beta hydrolase, partial [Acidobacteriota bacterium]|nr:alpha/beta hydrolase [Acidobacteriota bacterium]
AGDRRTGPDLSRFIAERGFAMVSIDYRLSREAVFPAALEDVKAAVRWIRSVAGEYGLAADRIGLWGASAGGHLAALAALSDVSLGIRAVADCYGPTDFLQMGPTHLRATSYESRFLGAPLDSVPDLVRQANPANYASTDAPPTLILHGTDDADVVPEQSVLLYEALAAAGANATLCLIDGMGHGFITDDFAAATSGRVRIRESRPGMAEYSADGPPMNFGAIETFFRRHLA